MKKRKESRPIVCAIVVAAGTSSRMGGIDKQSLLIGGVPVLVRTLLAFEESQLVDEVVVVTQQEKIPDLARQIREFECGKVTQLVCGGQTRQQSVACGVRACREDVQYYAIHDGARPLVTPGCIDRCIEDAWETGASFPGIPLQDTIKRIDEEGFVASTPSRQGIFCTQTPQVFSAPEYQKAMALAARERREYTDDCQLMESIGHRVHMVPGEVTNLKITTPQDVPLAQAILMGEDF